MTFDVFPFNDTIQILHALSFSSFIIWKHSSSIFSPSTPHSGSSCSYGMHCIFRFALSIFISKKDWLPNNCEAFLRKSFGNITIEFSLHIYYVLCHHYAKLNVLVALLSAILHSACLISASSVSFNLLPISLFYFGLHSNPLAIVYWAERSEQVSACMQSCFHISCWA